jgi:hypothetical protein
VLLCFGKGRARGRESGDRASVTDRVGRGRGPRWVGLVWWACGREGGGERLGRVGYIVWAQRRLDVDA